MRYSFPIVPLTLLSVKLQIKIIFPKKIINIRDYLNGNFFDCRIFVLNVYKTRNMHKTISCNSLYFEQFLHLWLGISRESVLLQLKEYLMHKI